MKKEGWKEGSWEAGKIGKGEEKITMPLFKKRAGAV